MSCDCNSYCPISEIDLYLYSNHAGQRFLLQNISPEYGSGDTTYRRRLLLEPAYLHHHLLEHIKIMTMTISAVITAKIRR